MIRKCVSWKTRCSLITLSETIQMEILPQTVESNPSLYLFIREGHQTPSLSCTATNTELTHTHGAYSLFLLAQRRLFISPCSTISFFLSFRWCTSSPWDLEWRTCSMRRPGWFWQWCVWVSLHWLNLFCPVEQKSAKSPSWLPTGTAFGTKLWSWADKPIVTWTLSLKYVEFYSKADL